MALVGTAGHADFTENGLGSMSALGFLREHGTSNNTVQPFEDKEDLFTRLSPMQSGSAIDNQD